MLLLNAAVGFIQEYQAGSIVDELKKTLALKATVLRDGRLFEIEASEVVLGDILQIEEVYQTNLTEFGEPILICYRVLSSLPMVALLPMMLFSKSTNLPLLESLLLSTSRRVINVMHLPVSSAVRLSW